MQSGGNTEGQQMLEEEHAWTPQKIVGGIVVLVVLGALVWWASTSGLLSPSGMTMEEIGPGQKLTRPTEAGTVIPNFPEEFLVEVRDGAPVLDSYSISYADRGVEQPVVAYFSNSPLADNVSVFGSQLEHTGWVVSQDADANATGITNYYARRGAEEVNITFEVVDGGTKVTISYITG